MARACLSAIFRGPRLGPADRGWASYAPKVELEVPPKKKVTMARVPVQAQHPIPKSGKTQLGVDVPTDLLWRLKSRAVDERRTVRELVIEALYEKLDG